MTKTTDRQKKHLVQNKTKATRSNKRTNEEINDKDIANDANTKFKEQKLNENIVESKIQSFGNEENNENGQIDNDKKIDDNEDSIITNFENNMKKMDLDVALKTLDKYDDHDVDDDNDDDDDEDKTDDELDTEQQNENNLSNKIVPNVQPREKTNIVEKIDSIKNVASFTKTYCETVVGFDSKGKKNMLEKINEQELLVLRSYVRKNTFRLIKFLSNEKLSMNSTIMNSLYEQISITDNRVKEEKYLGVRFVLQRMLNSKRNYCIEKLVKQLKCMFLFCIKNEYKHFTDYVFFQVVILSGTMFDLEQTSRFYDPKVPKDVRKAWYLFVYKFLICVNGDLLKSLQGSQAKEQKNIFSYVSVSDEAFVRWVLEIKYREVSAEAFNPQNEPKTFQKPKGQHDSLMYASRYYEIYTEVLEGRKITRNDWNDVFWVYYKVNHAILFRENSIISQESLARASQIPAMDDERLVQAVTLTNASNPLLALDDDEIIEAQVV